MTNDIWNTLRRNISDWICQQLSKACLGASRRKCIETRIDQGLSDASLKNIPTSVHCGDLSLYGSEGRIRLKVRTTKWTLSKADYF